jgi:hypothetical protein
MICLSDFGNTAELFPFSAGGVYCTSVQTDTGAALDSVLHTSKGRPATDGVCLPDCLETARLLCVTSPQCSNYSNREQSFMRLFLREKPQMVTQICRTARQPVRPLVRRGRLVRHIVQAEAKLACLSNHEDSGQIERTSRIACTSRSATCYRSLSQMHRCMSSFSLLMDHTT